MPKVTFVTPWHGPTHDLLPDYAAAVNGAEVVIVDNATPEPTAQALRAASEANGWTLVRNESNAGFAAGNNQGFARATGDVIVFLNSDVSAPPEFLRAIVNDVQDGALYGPSLGQQLVAGSWLPYLEGWCIAATRATWDAFTPLVDRHGGAGPWDAAAFPGPYWEDNDLCLRALQAGVRLVAAPWPIHHKGGRSAGPLTRHAHTFERNRATFGMRALEALDPVRAGERTAVRARYYQELATDSDIRHHLPTLYSLARGNVVELGALPGRATFALLAGVEAAREGRVISLDINNPAEIARGVNWWTSVQADSLNPGDYLLEQIGPIDLLLCDTQHTIEHLSAELAVWAPRVKPGGRICVHDTELFPGARRAVADYAAARGWPVTWVLPNNGMAIVEVR